jgi:hypothetical protein
MAKYRNDSRDQLSFFEEPAPDRAADLRAGDRWFIAGSVPHIYLPRVEVVLRRFDEFTVTFARPNAPLLSQWCLSLDNFFVLAKRIA